MTEATPFLRKYDITFLCPPPLGRELAFCMSFKRLAQLFSQLAKIRLPRPVEVKNRMSITTGTMYFIITL